MSQIKFKGEKQPLCKSCDNGVVTEDDNGKRYIFCDWMHHYVNIFVTDCTKYEKTGTMNEREMKQIGWVLDVKKGQVMGFVSPEKWRREHGED